MVYRSARLCFIIPLSPQIPPISAQRPWPTTRPDVVWIRLRSASQPWRYYRLPRPNVWDRRAQLRTWGGPSHEVRHDSVRQIFPKWRTGPRPFEHKWSNWKEKKIIKSWATLFYTHYRSIGTLRRTNRRVNLRLTRRRVRAAQNPWTTDSAYPISRTVKRYQPLYRLITPPEYKSCRHCCVLDKDNAFTCFAAVVLLSSSLQRDLLVRNLTNRNLRFRIFKRILKDSPNEIPFIVCPSTAHLIRFPPAAFRFREPSNFSNARNRRREHFLFLNRYCSCSLRLEACTHHKP
jgi:hypothetical protein